MITTLADQYLAQNAGRRYPLADDTPYTEVTSDTAILDLRCVVRGAHPDNPIRAYLTNAVQTTVASKPVKRLTVTLRDGSATVDTLNFDIPMDVSSQPYVSRAIGTAATGEMTVSAAAVSATVIPNRAKDVPFAWTTVICDSLKVMSVQSVNSDEDALDRDDDDGLAVTEALTGEILLAEGRNTEPYLDGNRLRLDIYKGAGLGENCQSLGSTQTCDNVLFSINGEKPGSDGEIRIVGENGVTVTPVPAENAIDITLDKEACDRLSKECKTACAGG